MTTRSWLDDEPPVTAAFAQAGRLFMAGLQRKLTVIAAAALYAAALASAILWTKYSHTPEYVLRVVEAETEPTGMPHPRRELAEYVRKAVFTSEPLMDVMTRHGLYPRLASKNPRAALDSFREDIDVGVSENYFVEQRPVGAAPRSALLVVSYRTADPEVAVEVTRELGELVVKHEQDVRGRDAKRAVDFAREQVEEARQALAVRRSKVAALRAELDGETEVAPERRVAFIGLLGSLPALERVEDERVRREASVAFGAALEQRGIGTVFQVVDDGLLPSDAGAKSARVLAGGAAFLLGLPLLVVALGAFAPKRALA